MVMLLIDGKVVRLRRGTMHRSGLMGKLLRIVGTMSGTSLDGIDTALIETDGESVVKRRAFAAWPYDDAFRDMLRVAITLAADVGDRAARPGVLADIERQLTDRHASAIRSFVSRNGLELTDLDAVSFHGQTVRHAPERALTMQLGDGERLAQTLGVDVVYDLRAADVAAGGEGAPLAPVYHRAMAAEIGGGPIAVLNIGGVANVTFIGTDGSLVAFDTGPGNAPIDDWMLHRTGRAIDRDGAAAARGRSDDDLLAQLMAHPFFELPPPKSLDRNVFDAGHIGALSLEDGAATLAAFTAAAIASAARFAPEPPERWLVCGGGRHNRAIMRALATHLAAPVLSAEAAGFDGDAIEAEAWAYLAARSLRGLPISFPGTTGVRAPMTGGVTARGR